MAGADRYVELRVSGGRDGVAEAGSLRDWLTRESELRGRVQVEQADIRPGEMGGLSDILIVALGSGGAVSVLASSLSIWLQHRRHDVTVEVSPRRHGRKVVVSAARAADALELLREALGHADDQTSDSELA